MCRILFLPSTIDTDVYIAEQNESEYVLSKVIFHYKHT